MGRVGSQKREGKSVLHKPGAEWLTREICEYYQDKAKDIPNHSIWDPKFSTLCRELKDRCDLTETQAINILNGYHINEYIAYHDQLKNRGDISTESNDDTKEYLEWLAAKDDKKRTAVDDYGMLDAD